MWDRFFSLHRPVVTSQEVNCRGALDNLAPQHKYSHYIYVSQHEMQVSDTFLGKKIKLGRFILDKS